MRISSSRSTSINLYFGKLKLRSLAGTQMSFQLLLGAGKGSGQIYGWPGAEQPQLLLDHNVGRDILCHADSSLPPSFLSSLLT